MGVCSWYRMGVLYIVSPMALTPGLPSLCALSAALSLVSWRQFSPISSIVGPISTHFLFMLSKLPPVFTPKFKNSCAHCVPCIESCNRVPHNSEFNVELFLPGFFGPRLIDFTILGFYMYLLIHFNRSCASIA